MYAGFANGYMNRLTYLYQNGYYWSMSPAYFNVGASAALEFDQYASGRVYGGDYVSGGYGLRPVINPQSNGTIIC